MAGDRKKLRRSFFQRQTKFCQIPKPAAAGFGVATKRVTAASWHCDKTQCLRARRTPEGVRTSHPLKRKKNRLSAVFFNWWELRGSNSRPSRCKRDALPAELNSHKDYE